VRVALGPADAGPVTADSLRSAFAVRYQALFGANAILPGADPVLLRIGVETTGIIAKPQLPVWPAASSGPASALRGNRPVYWPQGGWLDTPVYDGTRLTHGHRLAGHALIEQPGTTIAIPAGAQAEIDSMGNTIISLCGSAAGPA
jgi:N-methylhydantoinase A